MMRIFQCCKHSDPPTRSKFTNTWIGGVEEVQIPHLIYVWTRAIFFTFTLIESFVSTYLRFDEEGEPEKIAKYFIYLTNNGRWVAILTFTIEACLCSIRYYKEKKGIYKVNEKEVLPSFYKLYWFLCNCNSVLSILITVVYWVTIYNPETSRLDFGNFTGHLFIAIATIIDVFISDRPWKISHMIHTFLFSTVYLSFSVIYFFAGGTNFKEKPYIYTILNWTQAGKTCLYLLGVLIFVIFVHLFYYGLYRLRLVIKKKYLSKSSNTTNLSDLIMSPMETA